MKRTTFGIIGLAGLLLGAVAFGADETQISIMQFLASVFEAVKSIPALPFWGVVTVILKLVVDATKTETLGDFFNAFGPIGKRIIVLAVGLVLVGCTKLAAGAPLGEALVAVLGSTGAAMLLHEIIAAWKGEHSDVVHPVG